ncbi:MAG: response regulator [Gammaproteobacteria bacterium]
MQQAATLSRVDPLACVVVIDESAVVKEMFQSTSADLGVDVKLFSSASPAMGFLKRFKPDLVVMDIMLPDTDGLTFLQELRKTSLHRDTPIVMITAKDYAQDRLIAQHLGVLEFVAKPISPRTAHNLILKFGKSHGGEAKRMSRG